MFKRRRIAVLIASLLIGAPVGVAAVSEGLLSSSTEGANMESVAAEAENVVSAPAEAQSVDQSAAAGPMETPALPIYAKTDESVFPLSTDVRIRLPAEIAYLDRLESSQRAAGGLALRGDVFPPSTDDRVRLPAEIAYLEQLESPKLASAATTPAANNQNLALRD